MIKKLTDTQLVILSTASAREDGNVLPISKTVKAKGKTLDAVLNKLLKLVLVEEYRVDRKAPSWRRDGISRGIGLRMTDLGRNAISSGPAPLSSTAATAPAPFEKIRVIKPGTKNAMLVKLMQRRKGAALSEMTNATGWLPHTCRAALTRLRQKGVTIERVAASNGGSVYCVSSKHTGSA